MRELVALGVVSVGSRPTQPDEQGLVRLLPEGTIGPAEFSWEPFFEWLHRTLSSPQAGRKVEKLVATGSNERHLMLGLPRSGPSDVYFALIEEVGVPSSPPALPDGITHLWVFGAQNFRRVLAWFPEKGWFDVRDHWATG